MRLITAVKSITCSLLISTILLSGCVEKDARTLDPEKIANDFASKPGISVTKYRELWVSPDSSDGIALIDRVTIAGELIKYDRQHYSEYYGFIINHVSSEDETVASAAANSLRNAQGPESIDLLFAMLKSAKPVVGRAAAHALNYRLTTLRSLSVESEEYLLISSKVVSACGNSSTPAYVRSVMCTDR